MESSKHSLQDHHLLLLSSSSSSSSPTSSCTTLLHDSSSCYAATTPIPGGSPHLCWTPNIFLNSAAGNSLNSSYVNNQSLQNHQVHLVSSSLDSTMTPHHHQDLSFHHWANDTNNINTNIINPHQDLQQFSHSHNIKREFQYSKKFSELLSSSPSSSSTIEDHHNNQCSNSSHHRATTNFFGQIYPTINIPPSSSSSSSSTSSTTTFDMNLQALDLFHYSARSLMQDQLDLSSSRRNGVGSLSYNALHHNDHHYMQRPFSSNNMTVLPFSSTGAVVAETKRSDDEVLLLETKATHEAEVVPAPANKRSRLESRASCTPFKVRKEKLGDRIAALQQLVAPFGKTDTASVLMEAIGYIKFLQNQVETLSVPYLKPSRNKTHQRHIQGGTILNEERKRDLRSRGLCLVPLSCLSYMTDSGGAVWPPPNFGGGT